jgi:hypothetical protein
MVNTRRALRVDVRVGNQTAPLLSIPGIWVWRDSPPKNESPALLHGVASQTGSADATNPVSR